MVANSNSQFKPYLLSDVADESILDLVNRSVGLGSFGAGTANVIKGLNLLQSRPVLPAVSDKQVITFWTRPDINFTYNNIRNSRKLAWLCDFDNENSMANAIRCLLSPTGFHDIGSNKDPRSKLIDDKLAFIPLLSNTLKTTSGHPEVVAPIYTTDEGIGGEQMSYYDGRPDINQVWDMSCTFENFEGDPLIPLFAVWCEYGLQIAQGSVLQFPRNKIERRIDTNTRCFEIVLDRSLKYIQHINSTIALPKNVPYGSIFDYSSEASFTEAGQNINLVFSCHGCEYDDPILLWEFNETVKMFNKDMESKKGYRKVEGVIQIPDNSNQSCSVQNTGLFAKSMLNFKAYPWINGTELEWWAPDAEFKKIEDMCNKLKTPNDSTTNNNSNRKSNDSNRPTNPFKESVLDIEEVNKSSNTNSKTPTTRRT